MNRIKSSSSGAQLFFFLFFFSFVDVQQVHSSHLNRQIHFTWNISFSVCNRSPKNSFHRFHISFSRSFHIHHRSYNIQDDPHITLERIDSVFSQYISQFNHIIIIHLLWHTHTHITHTPTPTHEVCVNSCFLSNSIRYQLLMCIIHAIHPYIIRAIEDIDV